MLFNMYNAARFLQEETLVTWDTYHKRGDKSTGLTSSGSTNGARP